MTESDLLKPRYRVIADYPGSVNKTGNIISNKEGAPFDLVKYYECDKYPHLFRKLEWWEERKAEEMPKYVREEGRGVHPVMFFENGRVTYMAMYHEKWVVNENVMCFFEPATIEEYETHINQNK